MLCRRERALLGLRRGLIVQNIEGIAQLAVQKGEGTVGPEERACCAEGRGHCSAGCGRKRMRQIFGPLFREMSRGPYQIDTEICGHYRTAAIGPCSALSMGERGGFNAGFSARSCLGGVGEYSSHSVLTLFSGFHCLWPTLVYTFGFP